MMNLWIFLSKTGFMVKYFVLFGVAAQLIGATFYIKDVLKGKTKPNRVSWLLWFIAPMIGTAAALSEGARWPVLPAFMSGFVPFLVLIATFFNPRSYWKLEAFDYVCGLFSLLALALWGITREPAVAIIFAIVSDAFAAVPTVAKSWLYPATETPLTYSAGILSAGLGVLAVEDWVFSAYALPVYFILVNSAIVFSIYHKKLVKI
jgi:hypothetical protein